jgi:putative transposase
MNSIKSRKPNRLKNNNYASNGFYFITICIKNRQGFFGKIKNLEMILNPFGLIANKCWLDLPNHYKNCILHEYIIMPNHVHGIVEINNNVGAGFKPAPTFTSQSTIVNHPIKTHGLSEIIRGFKTFSSRRINEQLKINNYKIRFQWQRSFYDHIILNEQSFYNIRNYIINNAAHRN